MGHGDSDGISPFAMVTEPGLKVCPVVPAIPGRVDSGLTSSGAVEGDALAPKISLCSEFWRQPW